MKWKLYYSRVHAQIHLAVQFTIGVLTRFQNAPWKAGFLVLKGQKMVMSNTVALLRTVKSSWRIVRSVHTVSVANVPYSEHIRSVHLIMTSEQSVLRFVRSVRSVRIVTVRMLRAVDGSYAPYKPSELLTVRILSIYGACISYGRQSSELAEAFAPSV